MRRHTFGNHRKQLVHQGSHDYSSDKDVPNTGGKLHKQHSVMGGNLLRSYLEQRNEGLERPDKHSKDLQGPRFVSTFWRGGSRGEDNYLQNLK